jgi:hypothetical protein
MTRINWQDGGGHYPPGSDTPDAPWNQVDLVTDDHREAARLEVWVLDEWEYGEIGDADCTLDEFMEMIQTVCPAKYFDEEFQILLDATEAAHQMRGMAAAIRLFTDQRRAEIKLHAESWIDDRAEELAAAPGYF